MVVQSNSLDLQQFHLPCDKFYALTWADIFKKSLYYISGDKCEVYLAS